MCYVAEESIGIGPALARLMLLPASHSYHHFAGGGGGGITLQHKTWLVNVLGALQQTADASSDKVISCPVERGMHRCPWSL